MFLYILKSNYTHKNKKITNNHMQTNKLLTRTNFFFKKHTLHLIIVYLLFPNLCRHSVTRTLKIYIYNIVFAVKLHLTYMSSLTMIQGARFPLIFTVK
jgi:hypothetical protein